MHLISKTFHNQDYRLKFRKIYKNEAKLETKLSPFMLKEIRKSINKKQSTMQCHISLQYIQLHISICMYYTYAHTYMLKLKIVVRTFFQENISMSDRKNML